MSKKNKKIEVQGSETALFSQVKGITQNCSQVTQRLICNYWKFLSLLFFNILTSYINFNK